MKGFNLQQSPRKWALIAVALLLFAALKAWMVMHFLHGEQQATVVTVACADPVAGCQSEGLSVRFDRPPVHTQRFVVDLQLDQAGTTPPSALFSMVGMEMVPVRYLFVQKTAQHWTAEVILPVCVSGRQDWLMSLDANGRRYHLPFEAGWLAGQH